MIQLIEGDCLEKMMDIASGSVDMILCDLPYGTTQCKWDSIIDCTALWQSYRRLCGGVICLTACQPFTSTLVMSNPAMFRYEWIWEKNKATGFLDAKRRPLNNYESVLVFSVDMPTYYPQMVLGKKHKRGSRSTGPGEVYASFDNRHITESYLYYPKRIIAFDVERVPQHPTQKPVALMEYLIKTYTNEGDTVLDNCMGSGTTGVACVNTNRSFIGIEKDPEYFRIASERINNTLPSEIGGICTDPSTMSTITDASSVRP